MMTPLKIKNDAELTAWVKQQVAAGHDVFAVKGPPPEGASYGYTDEPDVLITNPVNVAWHCPTTGETFEIEYKA